MTKEDWAKVEKALSGLYGIAKLKVDGREVTLARELVGKNQLGIVVYVDGHWKGEWIGTKKDCPEQLYLCGRDRFAYTAKYRREVAKLSKRRRKEWGLDDADKKIRIYLPFWPNATAIRRHYQKTFESIELIEVVG